MIVRDEEDVLARCLESVSGLFDEIVIADTGSEDSTKSVAKRYTDRVLDFEWTDDFSAARNFSLRAARGDYIMWLDADDVVEGENYRLLKDVLDRLDAEKPDVVMLPYIVAFDERGGALLSYERERILRRGLFFEGAVHEAVAPQGKIIHANAAISHRKVKENQPGRNLGIFEKLLKEGKTLEPRMRYYYARELFGANRLEEAARAYLGCAEDGGAWVENRISAWFELAGCLELLGREKDSEEALFRALSLGEPRADLCCELGRRFLMKNDLMSARFWYSLAPEQFRRAKGGFVHADFGGYIPYLQLCVIYDRLGQHRLAESFNSLAGRFHPESEAVAANRSYFKTLLGERSE